MKNQMETMRGMGKPLEEMTREELERELAAAQEAFDRADNAVKKFDVQHGAEIAELTRKMSEAAAQLSSAEFVKYMPKQEFFNPALMDPETIGQDKYNALMADEDVLTRTEKARATEARLQRIVAEAERAEENIRMWNEEWIWFAKAQEKFTGEAQKIERRISPRLAQLRLALEANQKELGAELDKEQSEKNKDKVERLTQESAELRGQIRVEETKIERAMAAEGLKAPRPPEQPGWETNTLPKALRNMRGTEELTNWYRYARSSLNLKQLVATIGQSNWNEMRKSDKVDSTFKEQFRVDKRFYIQDPADYTLGLDPNIMDRWEKLDPFAANNLRKKLNDELVEIGKDEYETKYFDSGVLTQMLKTRMTEPLQAKNAELRDEATGAERRLRFTAGMEMFKNVATNLATNEFTMMPGILRKQYVVLKGLDHGTCAPFEERDIEDTLPMLNFFIGEFKRELESGGRYQMSIGNLLILKWVVNEDRGQRFTRLANIKEDLKPTFELIKGLAATAARAVRSTKYANETEAAEAIGEQYGRKINPFERIRKPSRAEK